MLASGHWYTSGTFWAAATVVVAVIFGVVTIVLWKLGPPRRVVVYSMPVAASLLTDAVRGDSLARSDLQVLYKGKHLAEPHMVSILVENRSRRDIRADDFDQKKPMAFDMGTEIVALLAVSGGNVIEVTSSQPPAEDGEIPRRDRVQIERTLIRRGEPITIELLTEGRPTLTCVSPLADVTVREGEPSGTPYWGALMPMIGVALGVLAFGALTLWVLSTRLFAGSAARSALWSLLAFVALLGIWVMTRVQKGARRGP